ncbi:DUF6241 domain-containing protein [Pseudalkalibacillus caeni]|uniref:Uncharacterized protein n=1 Tax=Exobacillus caeni TaxID=2574798 RepID=A0A5R9F2W5_9BACL|nr:DUF6241 domain-containing protein [Pseudalkalibacillus caeni]TLS36839.1 hypothetical protein FCL54_12845 [Pseudalkalibacillus caeni]
MKTKNLFLIFITIIVIACGVMYWAILEASESVNGIGKSAHSQQKADETSTSNEPKISESDSISIDEEGVPSEDRFQSLLHWMTHQKVKASEKWGKMQITEERIDQMLQVLNTVKGTTNEYEHQEFYEDALNQWSGGDFSNAVTVHNTIWKWNGGTIGKATGPMTKTEEEAYIAVHFK